MKVQDVIRMIGLVFGFGKEFVSRLFGHFEFLPVGDLLAVVVRELTALIYHTANRLGKPLGLGSVDDHGRNQLLALFGFPAGFPVESLRQAFRFLGWRSVVFYLV